MRPAGYSYALCDIGCRCHDIESDAADIFLMWIATRLVIDTADGYIRSIESCNLVPVVELEVGDVVSVPESSLPD